MKGVLAKIHIQEYGRIADAQIDLRPFTVFIGPNNTNKTWVAYAIHGLVQSLSASRFLFRPASAARPVSGFRSPDPIIGACRSAVERLCRDLLTVPRGGSYFKNMYRGELFEQVEIDESVDFSIDANGLTRLLALDRDPLKTGRVTLSMTRRDFLRGGVIDRLGIQIDQPMATLKIVPSNSDNIELPRHQHAVLGYRPTDIQQTVEEFVRWLGLAMFEGTVAFPAERNGLLSTYPLVLDRMGEEGTRLSHVSRDFIGLLRHAQLGQGSGEGAFHHINRVLEETVLRGRLAFDPTTELVGALTYTVDGGPTVGVEAAASMIRSLAGLHCYFRISALEHDLIIMDEPEMNAHPEAQVRLLEFFAELVRRRFRVLITTHSPYMLDHLNNLIAISKTPDEKRQDLTRGIGAALDPDDVAVYLFTEEGHVIDIFDREEEVLDLQTFSKSSDYVSNLYSKILSLQAEA